MLNRSKIWAATLLLGVFAAGIAIGGPVWNAFGHERYEEHGRRGGSSESRDRERKSYSELLQQDLNLTTEQRIAVDSILEVSQADMRSVWREMRAQIDTLRQEVAEDIMQQLDDEQQAIYRGLLERRRRRGDRDRGPRNDKHYE